MGLSGSAPATPSPPAATARAETGLVDAHAHLFNLLYLPVEGILARRGLPHDAAVWVGQGLRSLARRRADNRTADVAPLRVPRGDDDFAAVFDALRSAAETSLPEDLLVPRDVEPLGMGLAAWRAFRRLVPNAEALLRWLVLMTRTERELLVAAQRTFPSVRLFVNHLMALDSYYPLASAEYDFDTQLRRMSQLSPGDPGVVHFVAFDPALGDEAVHRVERALASGFGGVKFYPPNGYRPAGNAGGSGYPGLDPAAVDRVCRQLFAVCVERDVPVLTHCAPGGLESQHGMGLNSSPDAWRPVLDDPALASLRLALGHAGGTGGWLGREHVEFVDAALRLCAEYSQVYCDFGHFEEIVWSCGHRSTLRAQLTSRVPAGSKLERRVMFGSDWHVSAAVEDVSGYVDAWGEVMGERSDSARQAFFSGNALRYLRMNDSSLPTADRG